MRSDNLGYLEPVTSSSTTAVKQSEAHKSAVLESALDGIVTIDSTGRIIEFNPAAEQMFGLARELALGRPLAETIIPPSLRAAAPPRSRRSPASTKQSTSAGPATSGSATP